MLLPSFTAVCVVRETRARVARCEPVSVNEVISTQAVQALQTDRSVRVRACVVIIMLKRVRAADLRFQPPRCGLPTLPISIAAAAMRHTTQ